MRIQTFLFVGLCLGLYVTKAFACSCIQVTPTKAYEQSELIFFGSVTQFKVRGTPEIINFDNRSVRAYRSGRKATFKIHKIWKGPQEKEISILTGEGGGDCGFNFMVRNRKEASTAICLSEEII